MLLIGLFVSCAPKRVVLHEDRILDPLSERCSCPGVVNIEDFLLVGKARYVRDQKRLQMCASDRLIEELKD
jgi:hypothetical protein